MRWLLIPVLFFSGCIQYHKTVVVRHTVIKKEPHSAARIKANIADALKE